MSRSVAPAPRSAAPELEFSQGAPKIPSKIGIPVSIRILASDDGRMVNAPSNPRAEPKTIKSGHLSLIPCTEIGRPGPGASPGGRNWALAANSRFPECDGFIARTFSPWSVAGNGGYQPKKLILVYPTFFLSVGLSKHRHSQNVRRVFAHD